MPDTFAGNRTLLPYRGVGDGINICKSYWLEFRIRGFPFTDSHDFKFVTFYVPSLYNKMASEFIAELQKIPPVTRFLCASQLAVSLPVMLQLVSPRQVIFIWPFVIKNYEVILRLDEWRNGCSDLPGQIWRIFTSFFLGGSGINFIFEFVML